MAGLKKIYKLYKDVLVKYDPLCRGLKSPSRSKTPTVWKQQPPSSSRTGARSGSTTSSTSVPASSMEVRTCHLCGATNDQHLMAYCDICKHSYHIHCLTPPLDKYDTAIDVYSYSTSLFTSGCQGKPSSTGGSAVSVTEATPRYKSPTSPRPRPLTSRPPEQAEPEASLAGSTA